MMMAELVQGQASVAQPGTKDDFADTIRRVRQVKKRHRIESPVKEPHAWEDGNSLACVGPSPHPPAPLPVNHKPFLMHSASLLALVLTDASQVSIAEPTD